MTHRNRLHIIRCVCMEVELSIVDRIDKPRKADHSCLVGESNPNTQMAMHDHWCMLSMAPQVTMTISESNIHFHCQQLIDIIATTWNMLIMSSIKKILFAYFTFKHESVPEACFRYWAKTCVVCMIVWMKRAKRRGKNKIKTR